MSKWDMARFSLGAGPGSGSEARRGGRRPRGALTRTWKLGGIGVTRPARPRRVPGGSEGLRGVPRGSCSIATRASDPTVAPSATSVWDVERTRPGRVKNLKYLLTSSSPPSARTRKSSLDASFTVGGAAARESARGRLVAMPSPSRASALRLRADLLDVDAVTPGTDLHPPSAVARRPDARRGVLVRVRVRVRARARRGRGGTASSAWTPRGCVPRSPRRRGRRARARGRYVARSPAGTIATDTTVAPGEAREHVVGVRLPPAFPHLPRLGRAIRLPRHLRRHVHPRRRGRRDDARRDAPRPHAPSENADAAAVENAFDHLWSVSTAGRSAPWSRDETAPLGTPHHPSAVPARPSRRRFPWQPPRRARAGLQHRPRRRHAPPPRASPRSAPENRTRDDSFRRSRLTAAAGDSRCVRADVSLETRETVVVGAGRGGGAGPARKSRGGRGGGKALVLPKVWAETSEHTAGTLRTHFALAIPAEAPPTFRAANARCGGCSGSVYAAAGRRRRRGRGRPSNATSGGTMPVEMMSAAPRASANGTAAAARERARRGVGRGVVQTGWDAGEETGRRRTDRGWFASRRCRHHVVDEAGGRGGKGGHGEEAREDVRGARVDETSVRDHFRNSRRRA